MASVNHKRKEAMMMRVVSEVISEEVTNTNVSFPTVTGVQLTNDQSHLNVYLTFESNPKKSLENLNHAKGFIRKKLSNVPNMRKVPDIHLKIDESIERGRRIDEILKNIKDKESQQ